MKQNGKKINIYDKRATAYIVTELGKQLVIKNELRSDYSRALAAIKSLESQLRAQAEGLNTANSLAQSLQNSLLEKQRQCDEMDLKIQELIEKTDENSQVAVSPVANIYTVAFDDAQKIVATAKEKADDILKKADRIIGEKECCLESSQEILSNIETDVIEESKKITELIEEFRKKSELLLSKKAGCRKSSDLLKHKQGSVLQEIDDLIAQINQFILEDDNEFDSRQMPIPANVGKIDVEKYVQEQKAKAHAIKNQL